MTTNVLEITINPDIELDESRIVGMSDNLKGHLHTMLTHSAKKHNCHWTNLDWDVKMVDKQPVISVKKKL